MSLIDSTGQILPEIEVPSADKLRVYGDVTFLAFRSPRHQAMSMGEMRRYFEPAVELGQFRVFRFDDVPRAMFTWAWLNKDAERKLVAGDALEPEDWRSGKRLWIVDILAPYKGITASLVRWIMVPGQFTDESFRYRRVGPNNETRRVVHIDFEAKRLARVQSESAFLGRRG